MISSDELGHLVSANIITSDQAHKISSFQNHSPLKVDVTHHKTKYKFSIADTLYYLGGFIIVFAISYFLGTNWEEMGHPARIGFSFILFAFFGSTGLYLRQTRFKVASSLLLLVSCVSIPLLVHSIEWATGIWLPTNITSDGVPAYTYDLFLMHISKAWVLLELISLFLIGAIFYKLKDPILTLPISHLIWFFILDTSDLLFGTYQAPDMLMKAYLSLFAGLLLVLWGVYYNKSKDIRVGVWPWLYGLAIMFGALIYLRFDVDGSGAIFYQAFILLFGLTALFSATPLKSKTFLTFGALAIFWFIQDLSWTYFQGSLGFSFVLIISGLSTIGFGILMQKYYQREFAAK